MRPVVTLLYTLASKAILKDKISTQKSKITKAAGLIAISILILHLAFALFAFSLYSYFFSLLLSPALAALGSGALLLVLALGGFWMACRKMKTSSPQFDDKESSVAGAIRAFMQGFMEQGRG